jgi:hypothetical protein
MPVALLYWDALDIVVGAIRQSPVKAPLPKGGWIFAEQKDWGISQPSQ